MKNVPRDDAAPHREIWVCGVVIRRGLPLWVQRAGYRVAFRIAAIWWFVGRPTAHGVKLAICDGQQVMFVRHTYGPKVWELPGGGRHRDESPMAAARREAKEELGLAMDGWREVGLIVDRSYATAYLTCLMAEYDGQSLSVDQAELAEVAWASAAAPPQPLGRHAEDFLALSSFRSALRRNSS